ncbi:hypothetical protein ACQKKX_05770 [Neorhizobium sp. NPDC001467]|uniref:hypothetical protein n=1 Tax=Neorhizobium sp. NPDC001467 TaxID=3390595 RepID=UPI003CFD74C4
MAYLEAIHPGMALERESDAFLVEFLGPAAIRADLKGCNLIAPMATRCVAAGYKCVQAFEPMYASESTIDLQRCVEATVSERIE